MFLPNSFKKKGYFCFLFLVSEYNIPICSDLPGPFKMFFSRPAPCNQIVATHTFQ